MNRHLLRKISHMTRMCVYIYHRYSKHFLSIFYNGGSEIVVSALSEIFNQLHCFLVDPPPFRLRLMMPCVSQNPFLRGLERRWELSGENKTNMNCTDGKVVKTGVKKRSGDAYRKKKPFSSVWPRCIVVHVVV